MDRAPGLSVRLKLTLSYAGFLIARGRLAARRRVGVPPALRARPRDRRARVHSQPLRPPARVRSKGGRGVGVPAGARSRGRVDPRRPNARPVDSDHGRHSQGRDRIALPPDPSGRPQGRVPRTRRRLRRHARAARSTCRRTTEIRGQCVPRTTHAAGDHADTAGRGPQRSEQRRGRARRSPPRRQRPSDRPH